MATNNNNQDDNNNLQTTPISISSTTNPKPNNGEPLTKSTSPEEFILSVASNIANQALQYSDPDVWGVLTAISTKARQRRQVVNLMFFFLVIYYEFGVEFT